jgi:hypothetical protein
MSFRTSALVSAAVALGLSGVAPVGAQPQVPVRPRYSTFQNLFYPNQQPLANPGAGFLGLGPGLGNPAGPQAPGFVTPGSLAFPQNYPTVYTNPNVRQSGLVARFGYLNHWYASGYTSTVGGLGHWYQNGRANGRGVLGIGSGYGQVTSFGFGNPGGFVTGTGTNTGAYGPGGSLLGTAVGAGATFNQFRR